jgi:lipopolysaccharide/colanic/teichoic acid biosynthesis glycosyltransferase
VSIDEHKLNPRQAPGLVAVESESDTRVGGTKSSLGGWDDDCLPAAGRWHHPIKAGGEFVLVLLVFVVTLPIVALAFLIVRLTSRGPGLYSQKRVGIHGRLFDIYKLRTMYDDCERGSGPKWSNPDDPRVTPVGRFLRRSHLDELPQLWNVLRGDMTLVGPRPERPEFVARLELEIPQYRDRELVRPGVTGLAQIQLPPDTDTESVRRKLGYDLYYLREAGWWLDLRILFATVLKVAGVSQYRYCRWLRIPTTVVWERDSQNESEQSSTLGQVQPELA